jgi:hypothetical protein
MSPNPHPVVSPTLVEQVTIPSVCLFWASDADLFPVLDNCGQPIDAAVVQPTPDPDQLIEIWLFGRTFYPAQEGFAFTLQEVAALQAWADMLPNDTPGPDDLTRTELRLLAAATHIPCTGAELAQQADCSYDWARKVLARFVRWGLLRKVRAGYIRV